MTEEVTDEDTVRVQIEDLLVGLSTLSPTERGRLHEIEQMMLDDILVDNRRLRCAGCLKWMTALLLKARTPPKT